MDNRLEPIFEEQNPNGKSKSFSVEKLFAKAIGYWPGFAVCVLLALMGAYAYMQYTTPVYVINAKLLVKDDRKGGIAEGQIFQEIGVKSATSSVDNEIEIFKSKMLMRNVVSDLHLNIRYFVSGKLKPVEIYKALPFNIIPLYNDSTLTTDNVYQLDIKDNAVAFKKGSKIWKATIGDTVLLDIGAVYLRRDLTHIVTNFPNDIECVISPVDRVANDYINALDIGAINKQVSIVKLQLFDIIPARGVDVVNRLMAVYMQANVDDRNRVSESTIEFIDDRLGLVSSELSAIEGDIKTFKQDNNLTDVEGQSKALLEYSTDNTKQLTQQEIQLSIVKFLESFLEKNTGNTRAIPSTSFVQDLSLTSMVNNYNALLSQKERLLLSNTATSPYVKNIDVQLKYAREDMRNNLSSLKHALELSVSEMKTRLGILNTEIKKVPATEKEFLEYSRQQHIKQELYLYLLKKREETAISKSSTTPNARIVDVAESNNTPVSPNPLKVYLAAIVLGLLLPAVRVAGKELLSIKVTDRETISEYTPMSVIAEIGHNTKTTEPIVVTKNSRSKISEQFRALRTNLQFLLTNDDEKTILITSSMSGEGKSFISLNLASTLALSGKKVILLELDLRKPQISKALGINNENGFSGYAIGKLTVDAVIKPTGISDNLFIVPAGVIPPNPSELLMLPSVARLFTQLKAQFDVVIIDTAPVGLVTDAQVMARYADATLYIVRQNYTYKQQLGNAAQLYSEHKLPRMNIVWNDVDNKYGAYGYGQYGNGYFDDEDNKKGVKRIFTLFKR
jgi:tyrosine-protein kinase Etk/Wzc